MSDELRPHQRLTRAPSPLIQEAYGAPHIAADTTRFSYHLAAHRAHTVMLVERTIVSRQDGAAILRALTDLELAGVESIPSRPDLNLAAADRALRASSQALEQ